MSSTKKYLGLVVMLLAVAVVITYGFTSSWNENVPADSSLASQLGVVIRAFKRDVRERIDTEHYFPSTDTADTGKHRQGSGRIFTGPSGSPPANDASVPGRVWRQSDTGAVKYDTGSSWDDLISIPSTSVPSGVIVQWSGLLANVPSGWHLCDGTSGTPNLLDKFVKSVAVAENPGASGGASTHTHAVGTFAGGSHTHGTGSYVVSGLSGTTGFNSAAVGITYTSGASSATPAASPHTHDFSISSASFSGNSGSTSVSITGTSASASNDPSYLKLAYIMKL